MAGMAGHDGNKRTIFAGEPGARWVNQGHILRYQLLVAWNNTCGVCAQYDHQIGPWWGIPLHYGCRCRQHAIKPGAQSQPFVDYRQIIEGLDKHQQAAVMGASNYKLVQSGAVKWSDVVTPSRVRDFREVVSIKEFSVKDLEAGGVNPYQARKAWDAVHTKGHEAAEAKRHGLIARLKGAGLSQETIAQELAKGLARRVSIASNPTYEDAAGAKQGLPGLGGAHASEMAGILAGLRPGVVPKTSAPTKPQTPPAASAPGVTPAAAKPAWKPTMSEAEADEFARDSAVKETLFHVTRAGAEIRRVGFRLDVAEATGRVWGDGVYLAANEDTTNFYAVRAAAGHRLKVKVDVRKVLHFDATGRTGGESMINDLVDDALHKRVEFTKIKKGVEAKSNAILADFVEARRADPQALAGEAAGQWLAKRGYLNSDIKVDRAALGELLTKEGYDAVMITERGTVSGSVGGTQLIVLDPKNVVVVHE
jgi:hypothetical protein